MAETLFQKIIRGALPCHRIYEDAHVFAFLDIEPLALGHTLLVTREPAPTLADLSEASAAALGRALPPLCRALCRVTGASAYNVLQNNGMRAHQAVHHVHFHIIPKMADGRGLELAWRPQPLNEAEGQKLAAALGAALRP